MNIGDIELLKTTINNINKNNSIKIDIPLEIYENGFLTYRWLNFILKNCSDILYISSSLINKLIKNNEIQLLNIIFGYFKFYDNDFIYMLLYQYKNKTPTSVTYLNGIMSNNQYIISTNHSMENFQYYFVKVCEDGKENIIKYLIEHGADINKAYQFKENTLHCACQKGNEKIVKYLIENGADVNKVNRYNETPLYCACFEGNEKIAKYLIEHGDNIKIVDTFGFSPLFVSCRSGNENLVKYLVKLGADINKENKYAETPLFYACKGGNEKIVEYLVEQGSDIHKVIDVINSPKDIFHPHIYYGIGRLRTKENIIKYLIELKRKSKYG